MRSPRSGTGGRGSKPPSKTERRPTLGWQVIGWIERYLVHGPGDVQGEPIVLDDEFAAFLVKAYELRADGRRRYRRAFLSRAKGRAKSELAGMIACAEALGPVRFDGWDAEGEPVGRPVTAPEVLCFATEEGQSGNTYDNVEYMLRNLIDQHGDEFPGLDPGMTRTFIGGGGEIVPQTAKARSKDGGRSTFCVFDETHLYETAELRAMHATVRRNLGKRKIAEPWSLETSTMYRPGMNSVAEATHEYARAIGDGRIRDDTLLFDHREGPEEFDWDDDGQLLQALRETYGPFAEAMDLERLVHEIRDPQSDEADSRRYWLNQVVRATEQAFDPIQWASLERTFTVPAGAKITLGFDGARFRDATALVGTHIEEGYQFVLGLWERPENAPDDWEIDGSDVDEAVEAAFTTYRVVRMYADPPYWDTNIDAWAAKYGEKRVIAWHTFRNRQMAFALRAYQVAQRTGALTHEAHEGFARHLSNARRRLTRLRDDEDKPLWLIQKEHPHSPNKIDAAMAGCLSWEARGDALSSGQGGSGRSVYEDRGVEVI